MDNDAVLRVELRQPQFPHRNISLETRIPEATIRRVAEPIRRYSNPIDIMATTNMGALKVAEKIRADRKNIAKILAEEITEELIKIFGENDLLDGYADHEHTS